jgi:hypothetical protein
LRLVRNNREEEVKIERNPVMPILIWLVTESRKCRRLTEEDEAAAWGGCERSSGV